MIKKLLIALLLAGSISASAQINSFCVEIFNDLNGNGVLEDTEQGIEAIEVTIITAPMGIPYPLPYVITTSTNGFFCFNNLPDGVYTLQVTVPQGWQVSNGGSPFLTITIPSQTESTSRMGLQNTLGTPQFDKARYVVYPNPATTAVTVQAVNYNDAALNLFDITGKKLRYQSLTSDVTEFSVEGLPKAVYFLQLNSGDKVETVKLIIE